jgi:hypothetical protein
MASNGQLDQSQLVQAANGAPGQLLERSTAAAWASMVAAAASAGVHLAPEPDDGISSCYRSYANQQYAWDQYKNHGGATAASPGTSNHGWGTAIDIAMNDSVWNWLSAHGSDYGFSNAEGRSVGEKWHWVFVGGGSSTIGFSQDVLNRQQWLNKQFNAGLAEDGLLGPLTIAAIKTYQTFLKASWGYTGAIDGDWGDGTQAAHQRYWDSVNAAPAPTAQNPFGISDVKGLQKIAKLYGYTGALDNDWGPGSASGFSQFLRTNWGYSGNDVLGPVMWSAIARWLRAKWGYVGNDVPGPVMRGALSTANEKNWEQL